MTESSVMTKPVEFGKAHAARHDRACTGGVSDTLAATYPTSNPLATT
jgi:hypothetical protein